MKKYLAGLLLIAVFLVLFIPLASSNPDGLEKVAENFGAKEQKPIWDGLMTDYSVTFINNSYVSTLLTGIVGVILVFCAALILNKTLVTKKNNSVGKK
jgi:cobalt/nickel transport protein